MSHMMASREGATVATDGGGAERPPRLATTLYELLAALQDVVGPEEDALIVATVRHLLQSGRLTWLGEARERLCESAWEEAGIVNIGTSSELC
jgi:hypothetical protein